MKKICLISYTNIYVLPYARLYIDEIIKSGNECYLLYWDRDAKENRKKDFEGCKQYTYQKYVTGEDGKGKFSKAIGYLAATKYFKKIIKQEKFDSLIFLETHGAVLCSNILLKDYHKKYIVDVRDYSIENINLLYKREKEVIKNSYVTVISSPAYKRFLPDGKYVVSHNYVPFTCGEIKRVKDVNHYKSNVIRISFIGTVRFINMDKKILDLFKNDDRFIINYFGRGSEVLEKYCTVNGIKNVEFYGGFQSSETSYFYERTDIINNLYGNNSPYLDYALSNKLYHAAQFEIPILVCKDTYMEDVSKQYNLGFVFDFDNPLIKDELYEWYFSKDIRSLQEGAREFINVVKRENEQFFKEIRKFLEEG